MAYSMARPRTYKLFRLSSLTAALALLLSACVQPGAQAPAAPAAAAPAAEPTKAEAQVKAEPVAQSDQKVKIILVAHAASAWDSFWKVVEQGNNDAARDHNVDLTILTPDKWCPECVVKLIDQATAAKPDAIGITVSDGALFEDAIKRAVAAGIPVLTYNSGDQRPADKNIGLIYIGQDEYLAGQQGAQRFIKPRRACA
jgi:ABC-type sugar transport system substrate-binding protein